MASLIAGLGALAGRYDVLLCDVWGVIHDGHAAFPPACDSLARWRAEGGEVILISNAPRPAAEVAAQLVGLGAPRAAWSALVTSGDVTRTLLAESAPGPAFHIGPERDAPLWQSLGLAFSDLEEAAFLLATGLTDDEVETPEDYRPLLADAAALGLPMICANPDIVVQRGARLIPCAGALAQLYEALGGAVAMAGKPYPPIYDAALAEARRLAGGDVDRRRVLAVGDGLPTDIAGAEAQGLDALFIAGGIHGEALAPGGALDPGAVDRLLAEAGLAAAFALTALIW